MKRVVQISRELIIGSTLVAILLLGSSGSAKAADATASCQYPDKGPVPCSTVAFAQQTNVSVTTSDTQILAASDNATVILCNTAASGTVWLNLGGGTAVVGSGVPLPSTAGSNCGTFGPMSTGIHGIADAVTSTITLTLGN